LALIAGHLLARPHVLAFPIMVAWVGGLVAAMDRRGAPSFWLLPLMALWANMHGGFVLGIALIAPMALESVWTADAPLRKSIALRWTLFAIATLAASCLTPYGWDALFAARRILNLGAALDLIGEWRPANFAHPGSLEAVVALAFVLALWRGVRLPPIRLALVAGFALMALSHVRNAEILALLGPMVLATPLAQQFGRLGENLQSAGSPPQGLLCAGLALLLVVGTLTFGSIHRFEANARQSPVAAVEALKKMNCTRIFNDYDFGGFLIANGVPTFIDGRTELFGEKFMVDHNAATQATDPDELFRLLEEYRIEATLMRTQSPASKLLDVHGWQKVYADDLATIHVRTPAAHHAIEPVVAPDLK
jgi:hypothetical protein